MSKSIIIYPGTFLPPHGDNAIAIGRQYRAAGYEVILVKCCGDSLPCFTAQCWPAVPQCGKCSSEFDRVFTSHFAEHEIVEMWKSDNEHVDWDTFPAVSAFQTALRWGNLKHDREEYLEAEAIERNIGAIYPWMFWLLEKIRPERAFVFNGRFPYTYSFIQACRDTGTNFWSYECGERRGRIVFVHGNMIQSLKWPRIEADVISEGKTDSDISESAKEYFFMKSSLSNGLNKYIDGEPTKQLPDNFQPSGIVFLSSTFIESASCIVRNRSMMCFDLMDFELADILAGLLPDITIYYRSHPQLRRHPPYEIQVMKLRQYEQMNKNLVIIPPESNVDTYKMVDECAATVGTISSVIGYAAYKGRPTYSISRGPLSDFGFSMHCENPAMCARAILEGRYISARKNAELFGFWSMNSGVPSDASGIVDYCNKFETRGLYG